MRITKSVKMKAINYIIIFLLIGISCRKENEPFANSLIQINQSSYSHTVKYGKTGFDTLFIQFSVIGVPFKSDQQISIKLDSTYSKYAETGLIRLASNAVLPADSYSVKHPIIINSDLMKELDKKCFSLEIAQNTATAENYRKSTIAIYKQGLSDIFSDKYYCTESGYSNKYLIELENTFPISDTIMIKNFWDFTTSDTRIFFIVEKNSSITIDLPPQTFIDKQGLEYTVEGTGKSNPNGDFEIDYTLKKKGANTIFEKGKQKYSHN